MTLNRRKAPRADALLRRRGGSCSRSFSHSVSTLSPRLRQTALRTLRRERPAGLYLRSELAKSIKLQGTARAAS